MRRSKKQYHAIFAIVFDNSNETIEEAIEIGTRVIKSIDGAFNLKEARVLATDILKHLNYGTWFKPVD